MLNTLPLLLVPLAVANPPRSCDLCRTARVAPMPADYGRPYPPPDLPVGPNCPPNGPPAPLLAVQVVAPAGVTVSAAPGGGSSSFPAPATFGFRPGYAYRLELTTPVGKLYPTLEVRGSVVPRPGMIYMDYPLAVTVTDGDLNRVRAGGVVTKVAYLEDPTKAVPTAARPDQPLELTDLTLEQAVTTATANGRLVAVWRLGNRVPPADELAQGQVSNTVLLPGEMALAAPSAPPHFGWCGVPVYDAVLGPKPATEECITDGGDVGPRVGIGPGGRLGGLSPTDTVLEYSARGKRRVTVSNTVCVCVPRFVLRKVEVAAGGVQSASGLDQLKITEGSRGNTQVNPAVAVSTREKAAGFAVRMRAGVTVVVNGLLEVVAVTAPRGLASVSGLSQAVVVVEPAELSTPGEVTVTKSVEPSQAVKQGDEVTFTLRYRNGTHDPVTDLVLSDSLSGRFEYVPGSAKFDRPTNATTQPNEAGSVVLRFDIPGPIPPGGFGVVTFKARVR